MTASCSSHSVCALSTCTNGLACPICGARNAGCCLLLPIAFLATVGMLPHTTLFTGGLQASGLTNPIGHCYHKCTFICSPRGRLSMLLFLLSVLLLPATETIVLFNIMVVALMTIGRLQSVTVTIADVQGHALLCRRNPFNDVASSARLVELQILGRHLLVSRSFRAHDGPLRSTKQVSRYRRTFLQDSP